MKLLEKLKTFLLPLMEKWKSDKKKGEDLSSLGKERIGSVERRVISPWGRRRIRHRRTNHPWVKGK